jgi:hypothetical protein
MFNRRTIAIALLLLALTISTHAQRSSVVAGINTVHAPVPEPILKGQRAFISYELGAVTAFPDKWSGGPERAYSEFYSQMQTWGRYQLVSDPKDADIIFAVRLVAEEAYPQIRLGVSDPQGISLWGFVEAIDPAIFKKHRDASLSATVKLLVGDLQTLVGPGESDGDKKARKK